MGKFQVDLKTLVSLNLGFEAYFLLYCLYSKDLELLSSYTKNCKPLGTSVFLDLANSGYITIKGEYNDKTLFTYEMLGLTERGSSIFKKGMDLKLITN